MQVFNDLVEKGWKKLILEKEQEIENLKLFLQDEKEKNAYLMKNELRQWLIREKPREFSLPVPLPIAIKSHDNVSMTTNYADRVVYKRIDCFDYRVDDQVLSTIKDTSALDRNDHRDLEPMWKQHEEDMEVIKQLQEELRR